MLHIYWKIVHIDAHWVIWTCGIYMALEGHICCWNIYDNSMVKWSCLFWLICTVILGLYVGYSGQIVGHTCAVWLAIRWNVSSLMFLQIVDYCEFIWGIYTEIVALYLHRTNLHMWYLRSIFFVGVYYIYGNSMVIKSCCLFLFNLYVKYVSRLQ